MDVRSYNFLHESILSWSPLISGRRVVTANERTNERTNAVILLSQHNKFCLDCGGPFMLTAASGADVFSINRITAHAHTRAMHISFLPSCRLFLPFVASRLQAFSELRSYAKTWRLRWLARPPVKKSRCAEMKVWHRQQDVRENSSHWSLSSGMNEWMKVFFNFRVIKNWLEAGQFSPIHAWTETRQRKT